MKRIIILCSYLVSFSAFSTLGEGYDSCSAALWDKHQDIYNAVGRYIVGDYNEIQLNFVYRKNALKVILARKCSKAKQITDLGECGQHYAKGLRDTINEIIPIKFKRDKQNLPEFMYKRELKNSNLEKIKRYVFYNSDYHGC